MHLAPVCLQAETPWLDGKHVVFGHVEEGMDFVLGPLQNVQVDRSSRPLKRMAIADCGVL